MKYFYIRLLFAITLSFAFVVGLCSFILPSLEITTQNQISQKLAQDLGSKLVQNSLPQSPQTDSNSDQGTQTKSKKSKKSTKKNSSADNTKTQKAIEPKQSNTLTISLPLILDKINDNHLSWYYLTDGQGKLLGQTKSFAPDLQSYEENSRNLEWRNQKYYESVQQVTNGINLHVGFYVASIFDFQANPFDFGTNTPLILVYALLLTNFIVLCLLYLVSVASPAKTILTYFQKKDSGTGLTPGKLSVAFAVSDINDLKKLVESKDKLCQDRIDLIKDKDNTIRSLNMRFEQEMTAAQKEKTVLYLKEAESQFIDRLSSILDEQTGIEHLAETLLSQLQKEFPSAFEYALFYLITKKKESQLVSHIGFTTHPVEVYKGIGLLSTIPKDDGSDLCQILEPSSVVETQFRDIAELTTAKSIIVAPLRFQNRRLAYLVVFFRGQEQTLEHITRVLNRAASTTAKGLSHIISYEEQVEQSRTDELTGFPNKNYLPHLLKQLLAESDGTDKRQFSVFLVEGHDVLAINEKFGRPAGDALIQELGRRIDRLLHQRRTETMGSSGDHIIRYQGAQYMLILRLVDAKKAAIFAQRLRQVLESEEWPCGVGKWTTAIGITSYPEDSINPDELIVNVETALSYARGQSERNKIAHINQVPKAFRSAKLASNLGGSLDVFDPAALLQSLSISRKSGILTVTHPEGKMFWCFLENGKPTKARLGKFTGTAAIVEFLVLFESGDFVFSDLTSIESQTLDDIKKLPKPFDVPGSLERALMDGALAHDNYASAKELIKQTDLYVWPQPNSKKPDAFAPLKELRDPPSPEEEKTMKEMLLLANGKVQLKTIFEKLENVPTATVWRSAALLVQHDFVQLKKLATSMAL